MRLIPLLIFVFSILSTAPPASGQNCGCADDENCPFAFTPNTTTTVCYEFQDAFNNDLADPAQGVCGVSLYFEDDQIGALQLTLTSPNGTSVQLTGTTGNCNNWTPLSAWDILFVPCSEMCAPDTINGCELPCTFDNCPVDCLWPNAFMSGTYLPFSGCLEDFNTGPVNGQWCLEIENTAQFQGGTIFDFEVILCDQSGFMCCDADAGSLAFQPDVDACEGDSALQLTPQPLYGAVVPDTALYGYTYTVFSNGNLIAYDTMTDFRTYTAGTYQLCGLSFLLDDSLQLPPTGSAISAVDIYNDLYGPAPSFCGDIDTNCIVINIAAPPPVVALMDTICAGEEFFIGTTLYNTTGFFIDTIQSAGGCDSIVHLDLTVLQPDTTLIDTSICNDEMYIVGADTFLVSGQYEVLLENQFGCDSLVLLDLQVLMPFETNLTEIICLGDTIWVGSVPYTQTGVFSDTLLTTLHHCDSVVHLDLTVVEISLSIDPPQTLTCLTTQTTLTANAATSSGTLTYQWTTLDGNITSPANAASVQVDQPGMYYLSVTAANCTVEDSVMVEQSAQDPVAVALTSGPDVLTCTVTSVQLDASSSSGGPNLSFLWSGNVSDPGSPAPTVTEPGIYQVLVTDTDNGCTDTDVIEITENITPPVANAGADTSLSCFEPAIFLNGSASAPMGNISFQWEAVSSGNIIPPANVPNPGVDEAGVYQLTVTDLTNGCTDTDLVGVSNNMSTPMTLIDVAPPSILNCVVDTVFLDGSNSQNIQNVTFEWIGNIALGQGTPVAAVTQAGTYSLAIANTQTGCADTATVEVFANYDTPVADAGIGPDAISCLNTSEDIGGIGTTIGANVEHQWTTTNGMLTPPTDGPFAVATAPGLYYLTVTNTLSGCTAIDSVVVDDATETLEAHVVEQTGELTCDETTFLLDGSPSVMPPGGAGISWYNSAGELVASQLSFETNDPDSFWLVLTFGACTDSALVTVTGIDSLPFADAGSDGFVDCNTGQAILNGTNSDTGPNFTYQWTAIQGEIISNQTTPSPTVQGVGEYELEVTDNLTGCTVTDTVLVLLDSVACLPLVDAGADGTVYCSPILTNLQASGSVGPNFTIQWTMLPDSILPHTGFNPLVGEGTYVLAITNEAVGLTAYDTVTVTPDTTAPVADIVPFLLALTCPELEDCYSLDIGATSQGPSIAYEWASLDGNFCTNTDILNVEILGPGTYELVVTDLSNGCTATDNVEVRLSDFLYQTDIIPDNIQMDCGATDTTLTAVIQPPGGPLSFEWSSPFGEILNGANTPTAVVNANNPQNVFYFTITNSINLCTDTDSVIVFAPVNCEPSCQAGVSGVLDCNNATVELSGAGSSAGTDITYQWTALTGNLCGGELTQTACADEGGIYRLTVSRTYPNGAVFSTSCDVTVDDLRQLPDVEAGPNDDLNCRDTTLVLNGSGSATGPTVAYQWTTTNGHLIGGQTTLTPEVDQPGIYELTVTDTATGCFATDFVEIGINTTIPDAEAGPDQQITCASNTVLLNGSTSLSNAVFLWSTPDGNICTNPNLEDVNACAAGTYYFTVTDPANGCSHTDSTSVTADDDFPQVDVGNTLNYTCVDTVFTISSVVTMPGSGILEFSWYSTDGCFISPTDILQPTVNCPGTYVLTVTDMVNNCSSVASVIVNDDTTPPVANATNTLEINCDNPTPQLNGANSSPAGQLDFLWTTLNGNIVFGEMTPTPTIDAAGEYQLVVTNTSNQCQDSTTVTVTIDDNFPSVNAGPDTTLTCIRTQLYLDGSGSATGTNILYQWTGPGILNGANTPEPLIDLPGEYVLEVTDTSNGCRVTDTVLVGTDLTPPDANIAGPQSLLITCEIQTLSLSAASSSPSGNVSYAWSTTNGKIDSDLTGANITISAGGNYDLTVTDMTNGCTDEETVAVGEDTTPPFGQITQPPPLTCDSVSVQLQVLPPTNQPIYTFNWEGPGTIGNPDTPTPTVDKPGIYSVIITDITNGCESDTSIVVLQNIGPPTALAQTIGQLDCDDLTATVSGEGSSAGHVIYRWTTTSNGHIATPNALTSLVDAPGNYTLMVTDLDNGCTAEATTTVSAHSLPIDSVALSFDQPDCLNPEGFLFIDSVLGGTPPYTYSLNDSIFVLYPRFSYLDPGAYSLLVEDANGCSWETAISILLPNEVQVELGNDIFIEPGQNADLLAQVNLTPDEIASVVWTNLPDSVDCPQCLNQIVSPAETTTYHIEVFDSTGCFASDAVTVFVNNQQPFFVPSAFTPNGDNVNDLLIFYAHPGIEKVPSFSIYDRWGNRVFHLENFEPNNPYFGWDGNFNGQPMNPAVFAWKAIVEFSNGKRKAFYGDLTLVR